MLTIHARQMQALDQQQALRFRQQLGQAIRAEHEAFGELAPLIVDRLVGLALQRAQAYGLAAQDSQAQFVHLMAAAAPNFDSHPAIHAGLCNVAVPAEDRIEVLVERLPAGVWLEVDDRTSTLGWFLVEDGFGLAPAVRIARALVHAVPQDQVPPPATLATRVGAAVARAQVLGLATEDQQFAYAAADLVYGPGFESRLAWGPEALAADLAPDLQAGLLRARIAIDTGAWL